MSIMSTRRATRARVKPNKIHHHPHTITPVRMMREMFPLVCFTNSLKGWVTSRMKWLPCKPICTSYISN